MVYYTGNPDQQRIVIESSTLVEAMKAGQLIEVPVRVLKKRFLDSLEKIARTAKEDENILVIVCAHGLSGGRDEGNLMVGSPRPDAGQSYITPLDLSKRLATAKAKATVLSTSCYASKLLASEYSLIAASTADVSFSYPTSGSGRSRGGPFTTAFVRALGNELEAKTEKRLCVRTLFGLEKEVQEELFRLQPGHLPPQAMATSESNNSPDPFNLNVPPRMNSLLLSPRTAKPSPYVSKTPTMSTRSATSSTGSIPSTNSLINYYISSKPPITQSFRMLERWILWNKYGTLSEKDENKLRRFIQHNMVTNGIYNSLRQSLLLEGDIPVIEDFNNQAMRVVVNGLVGGSLKVGLIPNEIRSPGSDGIDTRQAAYLALLVEIRGRSAVLKALKAAIREKRLELESIV